MTLIVSYGSSLYADRKRVTAVGMGKYQGAAQIPKLVKMPGACYALSGTAPVLSEFDYLLNETLPYDLKAIVTYDWILNNLELVTGYHPDEINKHISLARLKHMRSIMLEPVKEYLDTIYTHLVLKTPYSVMFANANITDCMPHDIPVCQGSFELHANQMLAVGAGVDDLYRMSHFIGCMTSKEYDEVDLSTPEFNTLEPDVYNPLVYGACLTLLTRAFDTSTLASELTPERKDKFLTTFFDFAYIADRGGRRIVRKKGIFNKHFGTSNKRPLKECAFHRFSADREDDHKVSYVLKAAAVEDLKSKVKTKITIAESVEALAKNKE